MSQSEDYTLRENNSASTRSESAANDPLKIDSAPHYPDETKKEKKPRKKKETVVKETKTTAAPKERKKKDVSLEEMRNLINAGFHNATKDPNEFEYTACQFQEVGLSQDGKKVSETFFKIGNERVPNYLSDATKAFNRLDGFLNKLSSDNKEYPPASFVIASYPNKPPEARYSCRIEFGVSTNVCGYGSVVATAIVNAVLETEKHLKRKKSK